MAQGHCFLKCIIKPELYNIEVIFNMPLHNRRHCFSSIPKSFPNSELVQQFTPSNYFSVLINMYSIPSFLICITAKQLPNEDKINSEPKHGQKGTHILVPYLYPILGVVWSCRFGCMLTPQSSFLSSFLRIRIELSHCLTVSL